MGEVFYLREQGPDLPKDQSKCCSACGVDLPATAEFFARNKDGKLGLHSQCRECMRARKRLARKREREDDIEKVRARGREDARKHRRKHGIRTQEQRRQEALSATERTCTKCHKTKPVEDYRKNSALQTATQRTSWCTTCSNAYRRVWACKNLKEMNWARRLLIYTKRRSPKYPQDEFDLSIEFLHELYAEQKGLCAWSGIPMMTDIKSGLLMIKIGRASCRERV